MTRLRLTVLATFLLACAGPVVAQRAFEFTMLHGAVPDTSENFFAQTSDPLVLAMADSLLALPLLERGVHINGYIDYGDGGHNLGWSWHFIPDQWMLVHASIEICDGDPSYVEEHLSYWVDTLGYFCPWLSTVLREVPPTAVDDTDRSSVDLKASEIYPNPFNPVVAISFTVPRDCQVKLEVFNLLGERVACLVDERQNAGNKTVRWDASCLASGIYLYRIQVGEYEETKRMALIR